MSNRKKGTLIGGIVLIILGVLLLLENLYHNFSLTKLFLEYWPLILVYVGIKKGVLYFDRESKDFDRRSFSAVLTYLFIGFLILFRNLSLCNLGIREIKYYWPVIFIIMGIGKFIDYIAKRDVKVKGSEIVFLIFLVLFGISSSVLFKVDNFVKNRWGNVHYLFRNEVEGNRYGKLVEKFKFESKTSLKGIKKVKIVAGDSNVIFAKSDSDDLKIKELVKTYEGYKGKLKKTFFNNQIGKNEDLLTVKTPIVPNSYVKVIEEISVPEKINIVINSSNGDINGNNISDNIEVDRSYGNISFNGITGSLNIKNLSGCVNLKDVKGDVKLEIKDGSVNISNIDGTLGLVESFSHVKANGITGISNFSLDYGDAQFKSLEDDVFLKSNNCNLTLDVVKGNLEIKSSFGDLDGSDIGGNVVLDVKSGSVNFKNIEGNVSGKVSFLKFRIDGVKKGLKLKAMNTDLWAKKVEKSLFVENKFGSFYGEDCLGDVVVKENGGNIKYIVAKEGGLKNTSLFSKNGNISLVINKKIQPNLFFTAEFGKIFTPEEFSNKVFKKGTNMYFSLKNKNNVGKIECTTINGNVYFNWR